MSANTTIHIEALPKWTYFPDRARSNKYSVTTMTTVNKPYRKK